MQLKAGEYIKGSVWSWKTELETCSTYVEELGSIPELENNIPKDVEELGSKIELGNRLQRI